MSRKVKYEKWVPGVGGAHGQGEMVTFEGFFLKWGVESAELEGGVAVDTVAIIEEADGRVYTTSPHHLVQFVNPTTEES